MRISDERYNRHRRRVDLAWRLLRHEARTSTISRWTGMSGRRVRALVRNYADGDRGTEVKRPRGNSPYRIELLLRSRRQRLEAAMFANFCRAQRVYPASRLRDVESCLPEVARGERLCDAFESFKRDCPDSALTIEHGLLLVVALAKGEEVELGACERCRGVVLIDRLAGARQRCVHCSADAAATPIALLPDELGRRPWSSRDLEGASSPSKTPEL